VSQQPAFLVFCFEEQKGLYPASSFLPDIKLAEVYRIRISGLESGRIQHILNKPDRIRATVLLKFPDQDQDFQISFFGGDLTPTQS